MQLTAQDLSSSKPSPIQSINYFFTDYSNETQNPEQEDTALASHRYWITGNVISIMQTPRVSVSANYAHTQNYVISAQASAIEGPYVYGGSQFLHSYQEASLLYGLMTVHNPFQGSVSSDPV